MCSSSSTLAGAVPAAVAAAPTYCSSRQQRHAAAAAATPSRKASPRADVARGHSRGEAWPIQNTRKHMFSSANRMQRSNLPPPVYGPPMTCYPNLHTSVIFVPYFMRVCDYSIIVAGKGKIDEQAFLASHHFYFILCADTPTAVVGKKRNSRLGKPVVVVALHACAAVRVFCRAAQQFTGWTGRKCASTCRAPQDRRPGPGHLLLIVDAKEENWSRLVFPF